MPRGSARRARTARDLARRTPSRRSKDRILIVCEGGKTEPNYLRELKGSLGLTNADVEICGDECGSDPASVVITESNASRRIQDLIEFFAFLIVILVPLTTEPLIALAARECRQESISMWFDQFRVLSTEFCYIASLLVLHSSKLASIRPAIL